MKTRYWALNADHTLQPVTHDEWASTFESSRIVKQTRINDILISTVFLGVNYRSGNGPPVLFETMVFGGRLDQSMYRYSTWDEAVAGHSTTVDNVWAGLSWRKYLSMERVGQLIRDLLA